MMEEKVDTTPDGSQGNKPRLAWSAAVPIAAILPPDRLQKVHRIR
jgi:hypothetical protein